MTILVPGKYYWFRQTLKTGQTTEWQMCSVRQSLNDGMQYLYLGDTPVYITSETMRNREFVEIPLPKDGAPNFSTLWAGKAAYLSGIDENLSLIREIASAMQMMGFMAGQQIPQSVQDIEDDVRNMLEYLRLGLQ